MARENVARIRVIHRFTLVQLKFSRDGTSYHRPLSAQQARPKSTRYAEVFLVAVYNFAESLQVKRKGMP